MNKRRITEELLCTLSDTFVDREWFFAGLAVELATEDLKKGELRILLTGNVQATMKVTSIKKLKKGGPA